MWRNATLTLHLAGNALHSPSGSLLKMSNLYSYRTFRDTSAYGSALVTAFSCDRLSIWHTTRGKTAKSSVNFWTCFCPLQLQNTFITKSNSKYFSSYDWAKSWYCSVICFEIPGKLAALATATAWQLYWELLSNNSLHKLNFSWLLVIADLILWVEWGAWALHVNCAITAMILQI